MKSRLLILTTAVSLLVALPGPVGLAQQQTAAQQQSSVRYAITDLGTLGGTYSQAFFMNNKGSVGGTASLTDGSEHAILWQNGLKRDLGTLGGSDSTVFGSPNATGQVVGEAETSSPDPNGEDFCGFSAMGLPSSGTCLPFQWHGSMTPLPTLGGSNGAANMINQRGVIAGVAETATPDTACPAPQVLHFEPALWNEGKIKPLPTYGGDPDGVAFAINDYGQVAGASGDCSSFNSNTLTYLLALHALLWQHGTATDLGSLGGTFGNTALQINNHGQVVGVSDLAGDTIFHGFIWSPGTGMQDVGTIPGDTYSAALAINDADAVAGVSLDANFNPRAFLLLNGVPTDLNTLIPAGSTLKLMTACVISSRGEIAGLAMQKSTGEFRGYLATPAGSGNAGRAPLNGDPRY
jgi:probable HAF family extracellular repeat protein